MAKFKLFCDGGSRGNPGAAASAYAIFKSDDDLAPVVVEGRYLGVATNNQAEWQALQFGLEKCLLLDKEVDVDIFLDSELVVKQVLGIYKIKNPDLQVYAKLVKELLPKFSKYNISHIYREFNKVADAEVNRILDTL